MNVAIFSLSRMAERTVITTKYVRPCPAISGVRNARQKIYCYTYTGGVFFHFQINEASWHRPRRANYTEISLENLNTLAAPAAAAAAAAAFCTLRGRHIFLSLFFPSNR